MTCERQKLAGLLSIPFEIVACSWPRPVTIADSRWVSAPEWGAPQMPYRPQARWELLDHMPIWMLDWKSFFRGAQQLGEVWHESGQMRGFQIAFKVRVTGSGQLAIWSDDGCIIRRGDQILLEDREAHGLARHVIDVEKGDILDVAHWQMSGMWSWGAGFLPTPVTAGDVWEVLGPYQRQTETRLVAPDGPPIKMLTDGRNPYRAVVAAYSMILNGYVPEALFLYGDHQWSTAARACVEHYLPFASIVSTTDVRGRLEARAGPDLATEAIRYWYVMKACVELLEPPHEFCTLDDDVFVLGSVSDALEAFRTHDYVFTPDEDLSGDYYRLWGRLFQRKTPLATSAANTGLCWHRQKHELRSIAGAMMELAPDRAAATNGGVMYPEWIWQQGIVNTLYADDHVCALPTQRYPVMKLDGLPGGMLGYDYAGNPCDFAAVHFAGGWYARPTDLVTIALAPDILGPHASHEEPKPPGIWAGSTPTGLVAP